MAQRQMRRADWTHYLAVTALMVLGLRALDSWPLAVVVIVAYFAAISSETLLYCEARGWSKAEKP